MRPLFGEEERQIRKLNITLRHDVREDTLQIVALVHYVASHWECHTHVLLKFQLTLFEPCA